MVEKDVAAVQFFPAIRAAPILACENCIIGALRESATLRHPRRACRTRSRRLLGLPYKTAWFVCHRIRESLREAKIADGPLGGENTVVEADETYIVGKRLTYRRTGDGTNV